ncbi:MAG TPA: hypothetical protein VNF99_05290 [Stellaceae bacterium]|nr:hypothetical protein [Stellaceae bacterium]
MSAARQFAAAETGPIQLDAHRPPRRITPRQKMKIAIVLAVCLLALIGSLADGAATRTGLLLIGASDDRGAGTLGGITTILVWATIANIAACAGVAVIGYWLVSRPSAEVVELRPRRRKR